MGRWGSGEMGKWGSGEMGRWGSGEIELKPQNPNLQHLKPISCLLKYKVSVTKTHFEAILTPP
jgi:hypothetical protein